MKVVKTALSATTILAAVAATPAMAQIDTSSALTGTTTGPTSVSPNWSTVRMSGTGCNAAGTLAPLGQQYVGPVLPTVRGRHGQIAGDQPLVARNFASATVSGNNNTIPAGAVVMHPGPENECAILRYTVPAGGGGMYSVVAAFAATDSITATDSGDGVTGMVLRNGTRIGNAVNTNNSGESVRARSVLCPGDTLDFAVHMNGFYLHDTTMLSGRAERVGNAPIAACVTTATVGTNLGNSTLLNTGVMELGDPITMTGTPNSPRSNCCAPWAGVDIIPALQPQFPNGAGGAYTHNFAISSAVNAQMSAYLNYLHAMNSNVTQLTMTVQAANLGTGASAATSGTTIGGAQTIVWTWTPGGATMSMPGGPFWTGAPFPLTSWIGFQTTISVNGGQAGAALLGPDCRSAWSAWRAQPQQILQPGSTGSVVFETIGARGQIIRSRPVQVAPGARIQPNQLPRN